MEIIHNLGPAAGNGVGPKAPGNIYYNSMCVQPPNTVICGHMCLYVLKHLTDAALAGPDALNCNKFNNILLWTAINLIIYYIN